MRELSRTLGPRGPRFYDVDGVTTFVNVLDGSSRDGPRVATDEDMTAHPDAWTDYVSRGALDFPGKPPVTFSDPPGGRPLREAGPYAQRRARAAKASA